MAPNKQALLDSARNQVQKGNIPKAIKEYQKVMELGMGDVRILMKIGDLQAKLGKDDDAVQTYIEVARDYADGGFLPKAAAVYKRVLQLSPKLVEVHKSLAEVYHQTGLLSDAMAFYGSAGELLSEQGNVDGHIEILQRMIMMDPENVGIYIKLAETCSRVGRTEEAVEVFAQAAAILDEAGRIDEWVKVVERQIYHQPEPDLIKRLVRVYLERREGRAALAKLQLVYKDNHEDTECLGMLIEIFEMLDQEPKAHQVMREKARIHERLGEKAEARFEWERLLESHPDDHEALKALGRAKPKPEAAPLLSADILAPVSESMPVLEPMPAVVKAPTVAVPARPATPPPRPQPGARPAMLSPDDIQRLLVETDVYLRYGLFDKAQAHLDAIFAVEPNHVGALERLRSMRYTEGDYARANAVLLHLTRLVFPWDRERGLGYLREAYQVVPINEEANALANQLGLSEYDVFPHQQGLEESFFDVLGDDVSLDSMLAQVAADFAPPAGESTGAMSLEQDEKYETNTWNIENLIQGEPHHDAQVFDVDELDSLGGIEDLAEIGDMEHHEEVHDLEEFPDVEVDIDDFEDVDVHNLQPMPAGGNLSPEPATAMVGLEHMEPEEEEGELEDLFLHDDEEEEEEGVGQGDLAMDLEEIDFYLNQGLEADAANMLRELAARWPDHPEVSRRLAMLAAPPAASPPPVPPKPAPTPVVPPPVAARPVAPPPVVPPPVAPPPVAVAAPPSNGVKPAEQRAPSNVHSAQTAEHQSPMSAATSASTAEYGTASVSGDMALPPVPDGLIPATTAEPAFELGLAFFQAGLYEMAIAELTAVVQAGQQVFTGLFLIAESLMLAGRWVDAAHFYHDSLAYAQGHSNMVPHVHYRLGIACHQAGNPAAAREWYHHARAQAPDLFPDIDVRMQAL